MYLLERKAGDLLRVSERLGEDSYAEMLVDVRESF